MHCKTEMLRLNSIRKHSEVVRYSPHVENYEHDSCKRTDTGRK